MYVYYDDNGKIMCMIHANEPFADNEIPVNHGTPLYLDDTQYPDVWTNAGEYTIQNGTPVHTPIPDATKLANAIQGKINQLYQSMIAACETFSSSALGSAHTYLADERSMTMLSAEYAYVRSADYKGETVKYFTVDSGKLVHSGDQIAQVFLDGRAYVKAQEDKMDSLEAQAKAINLTGQTLQQAFDQLNSINW